MEARFCRLCGTPLKPAGAVDAPVSPGAKTVPLADEGRTTHGFPAEDGSASAPETARVRRSEWESILRRPAPSPSSQPEANNSQNFADNEATAAPVTTALAAGAGGNERVPEDSKSVQTVSAKGTQAKGEARADGDGKESSFQKPSAAKQKDARTRRPLQLAGIAFVALVVGLGALAFYYWRSSAGTNDSDAAAPVSASDRKRVVEEKLSEAETLLAEGRVADAISRLRYAIRLEPSNAKAHRLLAESLERTGAVNEAIDEYRAATQYDPGNEETALRYADALRRVGRTDEAREIYQKLSASSSAEVSRVAKEQLGAMQQQSASNEGQTRDANSPNGTEETAENTQTAAPSSSSSTRANAPATSANGSSGTTGAARAKNDPVTSYNTAMKIVQGKDIRKMNRADLIRAYELFQYAQSGPNSADANRRLQELDKELFERRKRKQ